MSFKSSLVSCRYKSR